MHNIRLQLPICLTDESITGVRQDFARKLFDGVELMRKFLLSVGKAQSMVGVINRIFGQMMAERQIKWEDLSSSEDGFNQLLRESTLKAF